jgi:predicted acyl esterase
MNRSVFLSLAVVAVLGLVHVSGASAAEAPLTARGSVEQVYVTGAPAGAALSLLDAGGQVLQTRTVNAQGGTLFREVAPGDGYRVRADGSGDLTEPLTVLTERSAPPSTEVYDQVIPSDGYGYLTTRDGTRLAYSVHPPQDIANTQGQDAPHLPVGQPSPVLIEYSGYGYARPEGPQSGIAALANIMGYTVVDVNMRGTGCSGGAFDFFEPLQGLDGYDVIETVARQPWVAHNKVGMLGISYGGISQLFTAKTQPPSLAAIAPLSVIDQTQTTLYPGGILNTGFAFNWAKERAHEALPAGPDSGQPWAWQRIQEGDQVCADNQALHAEAPDLIAKVRENDHYNPEVADPLAPLTFVDKIDVPVFMACQNTDEQTGGHCPTLASRMTGTSKKWFTFTNGTHVDALAPETFNKMYDFFQLYVAKEAPITKAAVMQASAPAVFQAIFGIEGMRMPVDPIQLLPTYDLALAAFEAQPPIRILFDNGAGDPENPGHPYPGFEKSFAAFPVPGTTAATWYLGSGGKLGDAPPLKSTADAFTWDAHARPLTDFTGNTGTGGLWGALPNYQWTQDPSGTAVSYLTAPLATATTVVGGGALHLWVKSSTPNVDLQATISEVRPDGKETFVQNGWVRGNMRKLDAAKSTSLAPVLSMREADVAPMPKNKFVEVVVPLYYQTHAYRPGSRIRVRVSAPNGDQPIWSFGETDPVGQAQVAIGQGPKTPSRLLLPVVPGVEVPTALPPCPGLRGQPCRDYQPIVNRAG